MLVPGRPERRRLRRGTVCGNRLVSLGSRPFGSLPRRPAGPASASRARPPTSLARILSGPCLGVRGRPRRGWYLGLMSRRLRPQFRYPARGGGPPDVGSRGRGSRVGLPPCPVPQPGGPSVPGLTARVPTTPWPAGTGGRTSGVAAPALVPARPRHPPAGEWLAVR